MGARPGAESGGGEPQAAQALLRARRQTFVGAGVVHAILQRRKKMVAGTTAPVASTTAIAKRIVLQSDFANVVETPTPGYVQLEIVFDGDQIQIWGPPSTP